MYQYQVIGTCNMTFENMFLNKKGFIMLDYKYVFINKLYSAAVHSVFHML